MIRLREWQSKYNSLDKLTPWVSVSITNQKNVKILKAMQSQAFLFRDPTQAHAEDKCQPAYRDKVIANAFPWVLYQIQDQDIPLAYLSEGESAASIKNYKSDFTPHGMRVSFISAYILDAKLPISIVAALVGHASIVMTIYYTVTTNQDYYEMLSSGHQDALAKAPARAAAALKNKQLKLSSSDFFDSNGNPVSQVYDTAPYSALAWKDFGVCPVACAKCNEGGEPIPPLNRIYYPVRPGFLGPSNCIVCRFFISGTPFIGGLKTLFAECNLETVEVSKRVEKFRVEMEDLNDLKAIARMKDMPFEYEAKLNIIQTLYQQEVERFDVLAEDTVRLAIMGYKAVAMLRSQSEDLENKSNQLAITGDNRILNIDLTDVSLFQNVTEICHNAEVYNCANPSLALPKLTKMLDVFAYNNGLSASIFLLTDEEQLRVCNQITDVLLNRVKGSWDDANNLIEGTVSLADLGISPEEIMEPVTNAMKALNHWSPATKNRIEVINV